MKSITGAQISKLYRKVERSPRSEDWMISTYLVLALIYVGFIFKIMLAGFSGSAIAIATILFAVSAALVHYLLDRCPRCKTKPLRFGSADENGKRFVVCETCKTYYEEWAAEFII